MKLHELKIKERYYFDILNGKKTFELRNDDRDFHEGDLVHFKVVDALQQSVIDAKRVFRITYVLKDVPEYGLADGYCIFGIKELS